MYFLAPAFMPPPTITVFSSSSVNVSWVFPDPVTQTRGIASSFAIYQYVKPSPLVPYNWVVSSSFKMLLGLNGIILYRY